MRAFQGDLFGPPANSAPAPEGFSYQPDLIGRDEERELVGQIQGLPFKPFDFHGHLANRQVVGFGLRCFFIALAASFGGGASGIAEERIANVLIGGAFGLVAVALAEIVWQRLAPTAPPS